MLGRLFGDDGGEAATRESLKRAREAFEGIKVPDMVWKDYAPELYSGDTANYELSKEDPVVRSAQQSILNKMSGLADKGLSEEDAAAFAKARGQGAQMSRAGTDAAIQNAQARGVGGSGMEFAMREIANQQGAERAANAGLEQASAAARQRALYNQAYAQGIGQMRSQDAQANQYNNDVVNKFNAMNTQNRNQMNQANVDQRNQSQQMNNQGRMDVQQRNYDNQMKRAAGVSGGYRDQANADAAAGAARGSERNQLIGIGAGMLGSYLGRKA